MNSAIYWGSSLAAVIFLSLSCFCYYRWRKAKFMNTVLDVELICRYPKQTQAQNQVRPVPDIFPDETSSCGYFIKNNRLQGPARVRSRHEEESGTQNTLGVNFGKDPDVTMEKYIDVLNEGNPDPSVRIRAPPPPDILA